MTNAYWPQPSPDSLGGLVGADDCRDAVRSMIVTWSPFYLAVLSERLSAAGQIGGVINGIIQPPNPLPMFGTWVDEPVFRSIGSGMPVAHLVTVPGTLGKPIQHGNGHITCTFRVLVSVQAFGTDWQTTADLTSWYEKVIRWCVMQHRSLGGFAAATRWSGVQYTGKIHTSTRTEGIAVTGFDVVVNDTMEVLRGPSTVPAAPFVAPPQDPTVLNGQTIVTVVKTPVTEPLP